MSNTFCPEHGAGVVVDEDGCCTTCGATATGVEADRVMRLLYEKEVRACVAERERDQLLATRNDRIVVADRERDDEVKKMFANLVGHSESSGPVGEERILCAAIYVDTGKAEPQRASYAYPKTGLLFTGWRHGDCFVTLHAWAQLLPVEEQARLDEQLRGLHQGFLTSRGRYVDRKEAADIARARGQTETQKRDLFSEDIY